MQRRAILTALFTAGALLVSGCAGGDGVRPDRPDATADAGAVAIVQPGGSQGDTACIEEANRRGIAMVFTGRRHFRH